MEIPVETSHATENLWTVDEVAAFFRCAVRHVHNLCRSGLPHMYVGRLLRFDPVEVRQYPMKIASVLLASSLAANLALVLSLSWRRPAEPPQATFTTLHQTADVAPAATAPTAAPPPPPPPLAADDFADLAGRLREAGVPRHVADVAVAYAIKQNFNQRRQAMGLGFGSIVRNPISHATSESAEVTAARARLDAEERAALQAHGAELKLSMDRQRELTGNLPSAKAQRLLQIIGDYREMEAQLYIDNPDRGAPETRAKVALLEQERRADIERLLTPAELEDYDLRTGNTAQMIRNRIGMFAVSEAEFRALHTALKTAEQAANAAGVSPRKRDRDAIYEPEIRRVLGEARYADLQAAAVQEETRVRTFGDAMRFTRSLNLPSTAANDLLVIQFDLRPRLLALEAARTATPEQRDAQIAALTGEAQAKLTVLLGEKGFAEYRRQIGQWLDAPLNRPSPSPPAAP